jgi:hypothetical protein
MKRKQKEDEKNNAANEKEGKRSRVSSVHSIASSIDETQKFTIK